MSKFFVGCPVRIIYSHNWPELAGKTGRIVGTGTYRYSPTNEARGLIGKDGWYVAPDVWGTDRAPAKAGDGAYITTRFLAMEDQLEPIVPEGMRPTTWEKCLWQPEKSLVTT